MTAHLDNSWGARLRAWFEIRDDETLDDYRQRQFERLALCATLFLGVYCPTLCVYAVVVGDMTLLGELLVTQGTIVTVCLVTYFLARSGRMGVAGLLFNLAITSVTVGGMAMTGTARGALMFLAIGIIVSALTFSARVILWVTLMNVLGAILLIVFAPPTDIHDPNMALVIHVGFFIIVGGLSYANAFGNQRQFERLAAARRTAERANTAKSEFLANMTHELRTPLNTIIGYTELIEEESEDLGVDAFDDDLARVLSSAHHLLSLINDVLDLSKIEADMLTIQNVKMDLGEVFTEISNAAKILSDQHNNRLVLELDGAHGQVESDAMRLRQIALNLLSNAAKFTDRGVITLRVGQGPGTWWFEVEDDGIGMSPEQQLRVFQKFEQATEDTSTLYGGTGLGLALVEQLVAALRGVLELESALGEGSRFRATFPR